MPFGLPRREEIRNFPLFREIRNIFPERKNLALGIFYYRDPQDPNHIEFLAEIKSGVLRGENDLKLPGGNREKVDRTFQDTLIRELREEAGVDLQHAVLQPLKPVDQIYRNRRERRIHLHAQPFALEFLDKVSFSPMPGEDIAGYEWVTLEEFKSRVRRPLYRDSIDGWLAEIRD